MLFDRIYIEISNVCNLKCSFCPEVLRPKKIMAPAQFRHVIQNVKHRARAVTLHVMGEPLAHPQFQEFLHILHEESMPLILTSNGILLNRYQDSLIQLPSYNTSIIKQINFSIHSFFDNFPNKDITIYLQSLVDFSKRFISQNPDAFINFRLWNLQGFDAELTSKNKIVYDALESLFSNPELPHQLNVKAQKSYRLDRHIKLHFDTQFEWPSLNSPHQASDGFCYGLSSQLAILTEGTVVPCCLDKEAVISLGSIFEVDLKAILATPRAQGIIQGFKNQVAIEPLCQKCQFKQRFQHHSKVLSD